MNIEDLPTIEFPNFLDGYVPDIDPKILPPTACALADEVELRDGRPRQVRRFIATTGQGLSGIPAKLYVFRLLNGTCKIMLQTTTYLYNGADIADPTTWSSLNPAATTLNGTAGEPPWMATFPYVSGGSLANLLVSVNGLSDTPKKWDGAASEYSALGGTPPRARFVCVHPRANRLVLAYTSPNGASTPAAPHQVAWCDAGEPEDWTTGLAGTAELAATPRGIQGLAVLGDEVLVVKRDSIWRMVYVGGSDVFAWLPIVGAPGCIASDSIVSTPMGAYYLSEEGVQRIESPGIPPRNLSEGKQAMTSKGLLNLGWKKALTYNTSVGRAYAAYDADLRQYILAFPTGDNTYPSSAIAYHERYDAITTLSWPYNSFILNGGTGKFATDNSPGYAYRVADDGVPHAGRRFGVLTGTIQPVPGRIVTLREAQIIRDVASPTGGTVSVVVQTSEDGNTWSDSETVNVAAAGNGRMAFRATGRFVRIWLKSATTATAHIAVHSLMGWLEPRGPR